MKNLFCTRITLIILVITVIYSHAGTPSIITPAMEIIKHNSVVTILDRDSLKITVFDQFGNVLSGIQIKEKILGIGYVSADVNGNCLIAIVIQKSSGENGIEEVYFAKNGQEKWRLSISSFAPLIVSPSGKLAMLAAGTFRDFVVLDVTDPQKKIENPFNSMQGSVNYKGSFSNDGSIVMVTSTGILYKYNVDLNKIESQTELKTPQGQLLTISGNEWSSSNFNSNEDQTLFGTLMLEESNDNENRINWLLVYDNNASVKQQIRVERRLQDIQLSDKTPIVTELNKKTQKWMRVIYRGNQSTAEIADSNSYDMVGSTTIKDSTISFFSKGDKDRVRSYDMRTRKLKKAQGTIPLFKDNGKINAAFIKVQK